MAAASPGVSLLASGVLTGVRADTGMHATGDTAVVKATPLARDSSGSAKSPGGMS